MILRYRKYCRVDQLQEELSMFDVSISAKICPNTLVVLMDIEIQDPDESTILIIDDIVAGHVPIVDFAPPSASGVVEPVIEVRDIP